MRPFKYSHEIWRLYFDCPHITACAQEVMPRAKRSASKKRASTPSVPSDHRKLTVQATASSQSERAAVTKPKLFRDGISSFAEDGFTINGRPTFYIVIIMVAVFGAASYFLQEHVLSANSAHVVFLVGSYVVFSSYFTFDYFLRQYSSSYSKIPDDKRFYVLMNLIKSGVLLSYTPMAMQLLYETLALDVWNSNKIRIMGTLYCIPDFVSLFVVRKMAKSTQIHHVVVCVFNVVSVYNDYTQENVIRAIMVYAVFSTFAYLVNLLLASRFLPTTYLMRVILSATALVIYIACCAINWFWQVWFLSTIISTQFVYVVVYACLVLMLVSDDVILMQWLGKNLKRNAAGNPFASAKKTNEKKS